jgi:uncharacterized protein YdaU (DUF1376 family)
LLEVTKLGGIYNDQESKQRREGIEIGIAQYFEEVAGRWHDLKTINDLIVELKKEANESYEKSIKTSSGKLGLSVPRDRNSEFEPKIIRKHQNDIFGVEDEIRPLMYLRPLDHLFEISRV